MKGIIFDLDGVLINSAPDMAVSINKTLEHFGFSTIIFLLNKDQTKIEIPATHLGLPVTEIDSYAFKNNEKITEVILGENIKVIGKEAFYNCTKLQKTIIPASVINCGERAFFGTSCSIYVDITQKPSSWASNWCNSGNKVYWKGQWVYVSDTPVPL